MNPLKDLSNFGQSVWLDFLSRAFIRDGKLAHALDADNITGVTSNPSIFEKAIGHSEDYDDQIGQLIGKGVTDPRKLFRELAVTDIKAACDVLMPVHKRSNGADGFVSMEVSPDLANDREGTLREARELWKSIGKPNLMIKVPATEAGLPAIRQLTSEGINVNITLLFARDVYEKVAMAYIEGLEKQEGNLADMASVASFFVSRIDSQVDEQIDAKFDSASETDKAALQRARGRVAIANARLAYQQYKTLFSGARWETLAERGARPQRLLWASTSTKNKAYSDILYVETLIGPDTVNTVPPETLEAFRDHGKPAATLDTCVAESEAILDGLKKAGIWLDKTTTELTLDGVKKFEEAADKIYAAIAKKRDALKSGHGNAHAAE
ncbi:MAG TPA: transaldolase [Rhizomicrobium sp.]|jgi:transaldolase/glucose-6-phosphate isomerase